MKKINKNIQSLRVINAKFGRYEKLMNDLVSITKKASNLTYWQDLKLSKQSQIELITTFVTSMVMAIKVRFKNQPFASIMVTDFLRYAYSKLIDKKLFQEHEFVGLMLKKLSLLNVGKSGYISKKDTKQDVEKYHKLLKSILGKHKPTRKEFLKGVLELIKTHMRVYKQATNLLK